MRQLFHISPFVNSSIRPFPYFHIPTLLPPHSSIRQFAHFHTSIFPHYFSPIRQFVNSPIFILPYSHITFPSFVNSSIRPFPYFHIPTLLSPLFHSGKFADDTPGRVLIDFTMPRNWLQGTGDDIAIPVMVRSVSHEHSAILLDPANQVKMLHA